MWRCGKFSFDERMPIIMGILNVTPNSFSDGGENASLDGAVAKALAMVEQGASIIDIGGESTAPGSQPVAAEEELARVLPVINALAKHDICLSIDTRKPTVAHAAVEAGASIINDVSGFNNPEMVEVAADCDAGLVVVHGDGLAYSPESPVEYNDVVRETCEFLKERTAALQQAGIDAERICVDPGPGFSKSPSQTLELVRNIHEVARLGYPVMAALSRKSYIGQAYGIENPKDRDHISATEALMACELGATVVRTHNVEATAAALKDLRPLVVLGLGCNVALVANPGEEQEGKIAQLNHAIGQLCVVPDSQIVDISPFYASKPAYFEEQEDFVNAVVLMRCGVPPLELLKYLQAIENSLGRVRERENGPRTCDIDIIDYQMYEATSDQLNLPHPLALERDFVVKPLMGLRPNFVFANNTAITSENVRVGEAEIIACCA